MLKIEFIGHVGSDATLKQLENANVINFSIAVNESFKDKTGTKQIKTKWIECYLKKAEAKYSSYSEADKDEAGCTVIANECNEEIAK